MAINMLKIRDDHQPLEFAADGEAFQPRAGSQASWLTGETFGHKELRKSVERTVDWKEIADDWQQIGVPFEEQDLESNYEQPNQEC